MIGVLSVVVLLLLGGCGGRDASSAAGVVEPTVIDSAGTAIVLHPPGPFADTVPDAPIATVGREGEEAYELYRVHAVSSLATGNVVVANGGTHELRFFGPDGRHLRSVGQRGDGPEEFGFLSTLWLQPGDTLVVLDAGRRRLVKFDSTGSLVRGESYARELTGHAEPQGFSIYGRPGLVGLLDDGTRLTIGASGVTLEGRPGRRSWPVALVLHRGAVEDSVGTFVSRVSWERPSEASPFDQIASIPFTTRLVFAVGPDRVYVAEREAHRIRVHDDRGRLVAIVGESVPPPTVTEEDRAAYRRDREAEDRPHPDDVPFPERLPGYDQLLVSHEGRIWARRHPRPGDAVHHWVVYPTSDPDPSTRGSVTPVRRFVLPAGRVHSVRDGRIYTTRESDLGIETVVVYEVPE